MKFSKNKEIYVLIFLFLVSLNPTFIKSQNLCPFKELENFLQYYRKGINPTEKEDNDQYKWEFIHCVNDYHNSTYLYKNSKDPYFKENSGVIIGSSINLGKLNEDFINNNLTNLKQDDRDKLIKLIGKFGKDAELIFDDITFNFTEDEINYINKQVYNQYYIEMKKYFGLERMNIGHNKYSIELVLLTFFVKYYEMDKYLLEAKECLKAHLNNLFLLSYFFLNLRSDNYLQKKLWSMVTLSSDIGYNNNYIRHIGLYFDSELESSNEKNFKSFIQNFLQLVGFKDYFYSMGNTSGLIYEDPLNTDNFNKFIESHIFCTNDSVQENITKGISYFKDAFNKQIIENIYYEKHLVIFINDISNIKEEIATKYFVDNGIQVILFSKINKKSDEIIIKEKFKDEFNIITFYDYSELSTKKEYIILLRNLLNYNIQYYTYIDETINIQNVKTFGKNNMHNFKINFDKDILFPPDDSENYYFHISLVYNNSKEIENKYKNNSNLTFLLSENNPFPDIINYSIVNFCFNETVSSDPRLSPFINYLINDNTKNYFYISITNAYDIEYSLIINLTSTISKNIEATNGDFGHENIIPNTTDSIATFSDKCIQKNCMIDNFNFFKYFSSGVHFTNAQDNFSKIIDMDMIGCLYKNVYCAYFVIEQSETKYEKGPMIGYGLNLSNFTSVNFFNGSIPLYIINKLHPFLADTIDMKNAEAILKDYNLYLTQEETYALNTYYLSSIFHDLENNHKKFKELNANLKLSIFLRVLEQRPSRDYIDSYISDLANDIDKYIRNLRNLERSRMTSPLTLDFQMMITQTKNILQPKKCLLSFVIGKSLIWSDEFYDLISKIVITNYRISISYYDPESNTAEMLIDFNEDIDEIKNKILEIKNNTLKKTEKVDIDIVLRQQKKLFKYYDEGIKKCIVIISTREDDIFYKYEFTKPSIDLLEDLHNSGITIFDYSDHINFILDDEDDNLGFFNSTKSKYIQFVPFLNFSDMNQNTITLTNIINRFPIPINKIQEIYLDMERDEEIVYEFDLKKEIDKLKEKNYFDKYNKLKFKFINSGLKIYFSNKFIFPNNYSNDFNFSANDENREVLYDLKSLDPFHHKFFMTIHSTENRIDNSVVNLDLCDDNNKCLKNDFYFKFYIAFIIVGVFVLFYGIYICCCENTFKKEGNIFEIK